MAILDLDGSGGRGARHKATLDTLLALLVGALALGFLASVPYWPREWTERPVPPPVVIPNAYSVLAHARPAPSATLTLPPGLGDVIQQRGPNGETGLIARETAITMVRLRGTGDVVAFGAVAPTGAVGRSVTVRGAAGFTFADRGLTVVRWTEAGLMYEISSRTLDASRLTEIAAQLR